MKKPNFFQRLRLAFRYSLSSELNWLLGINGATSYSGVSVSETSALQLGAVFAAVRLISKTIASLPLNIYKRRDDGGKDKFSNHYLYPVLHDSPNREMTSFELREIITGHLTTWGNAYGEIVWGNDGRVKELWPLRPDHMKVERKNQELVYTYFLPDKQPFIFPPGLIWHLRGFSQDGLKGLSVISMARESIGLGLATEEFGSRYFGSGAAPDAVLIHPGKLTPEAVGSLKKSWEDQHKGLSKSHRIAILQEGLTYQQIGIPPEDSQFLQTRQFQVREIARIFEVPPHMIGDLSDATFSNIEEQSIEFVVNCIRPWCVRIEQSINKFLLSGSDNRDYFAEFLIDGLLRGNIQSRYTAYATAIQNGIFSPNDVLELENRNPYDGGDQHFIQLNMQPVEQIGQRFIRDLLKSKEIESILNGKELIQIPSTEIRSSLSRKKLANAYKPIFEDIAARIIRSEKKNVLAAAKKFLARRDKGQFDAWLDDFYKEHKDYIKSNMLPAFRSYGEAISAVAAQEINSKKEFDAKLEVFVDDYANVYTSRHIGRSMGDIKNSVAKPSDDVEDLQTLFEEWETNRPTQIAKNEVIKEGMAVTKTVFIAGGITKLVWMASANACPICSELDGVIIGVESSFNSSDESIGSVGHPPLHLGCECDISPG